MWNLNEIIETLKSFGSKERIEKSKSMFPTSMEVLGLYNSDLKAVLKEVYEIIKKEPRQTFLKLSMDLVATRIMECQLMAWLLLEKAGMVESISRSELGKLEGVLDNWASVDGYGIIIYGILWRKGTLSDQDVLILQKQEDVWYRRLALVACVSLNLKSRDGKGDVSRTLMVCRNAVDDHHDMIVKALSWALRSLIRWDNQAVEDFISKHEGRLNKRVIREVRHKLDFGTKN
jgi:3-methyladenine DNA glycosylase AlkD